jgi:hypothetical protein
MVRSGIPSPGGHVTSRELSNTVIGQSHPCFLMERMQHSVSSGVLKLIITMFFFIS